MGFTLLMAELKTSKASLPDFLAMVSSAPYMIRSATDFLPRVISTFMNLATSSLLCFGSGRISRFGISLRRGMALSVRVVCLGGLGSFRPVLRPRLLPVLHAGGIEAPAH